MNKDNSFLSVRKEEIKDIDLINKILDLKPYINDDIPNNREWIE